MYVNKKVVLMTVIICCLSGIFSGIVLIQNLHSVRQYLAAYIKNRMGQSIDCDFQTDVIACSFLPLSITCCNTQATPLNSNQPIPWSWKCKKLSFNFSWFSLIFLQKLTATIEVHDLSLYSLVDQKKIAISDHLQKILLGNILKIPISIKAIKINRAALTLSAPAYNAKAYLEFSGLSKKIRQQFKSAWYFSKGTISVNNKPYLEHLNGTFHNHFIDKEPLTASLKACAFIRLLPEQKDLVYVNTDFTSNQWIIDAHNQEHSITAHVIIKPENTVLHMTCNSALLANMASIPFLDFLDDAITLDALINPSWHAQGTFKSEKLPFYCNWQYNDQTVSLDLTNTTSIIIPSSHWLIKPLSSLAHCNIKLSETFATLTIPLQQVITNKQVSHTGTITMRNNTLHGSVQLDPYTLDYNGLLNPFCIKKCTCHNKKNIVFDLQGAINKDNLTFHATIDYQQVAAWLPKHWQDLFTGNGTLTVQGTCCWPISTFNVTLNDGCILLGQSHNICTNAHATIKLNHQTRTVHLSDITGTFHQGTVYCPQARFNFNQQWNLVYAHVPFNIKNCLVNWNKNIGFFSGNFLLSSAQGSRTQLDATVMIDKAYLASTLAAQLQQRNTLAHTIASIPLDTHITIETNKPLHIDLPGLHTKAHALLTIDGPLTQTHVNGTITLRNGTINLPYGTFNIIAGTIHLNGDNLDNSLVELTAKAVIQQHNITLQVCGTISNPTIRLSSIPALSEQHIAALLIAGTPENLLNTVVPSLIAELLKQLLMPKTSANNQSAIKKFISNLNYVKFVPRFNDPSGRSGIYGGIEIDFNDRLKATIQKPIDLQENFAVEFDYRLSDELSLAAFKNEQGQLGGQARIRFKW